MSIYLQPSSSSEFITVAILKVAVFGVFLGNLIGNPVFASNGSMATINNDTNLARQYPYRIIDSRPHDSSLFTQGWQRHRGFFYESSGRYQQSKVVRYPVNQIDKPAEVIIQLAPDYFSEGLAIVDRQLFLLSWKSGLGWVYNLDDLSLDRQFRYTGEGWGLTYNGRQLIMSDGSAQLQFRQPADFSLVRKLPVTLNSMALTQLNELEFCRGKLWANIWQDARIVEIDTDSGSVTGMIDLSALVTRVKQTQPADDSTRAINDLLSTDSVLNGISCGDSERQLWVTGKYWPRSYKIQW